MGGMGGGMGGMGGGMGGMGGGMGGMGGGMGGMGGGMGGMFAVPDDKAKTPLAKHHSASSVDVTPWTERLSQANEEQAAEVDREIRREVEQHVALAEAHVEANNLAAAQQEFEQVIGLVSGLLSAGYPQPWMYQALSLSMEACEYPSEDIKRVLLSSLDFEGSTEHSLRIAKYLAQKGMHSEALELLRDVAFLEPHRYDVFSLAMPLAEETQDFEALRWVCLGVLSKAWPKEHAALYDEAEMLAKVTTLKLAQEGRVMEANAFEEQVKQARKRDLAVRVTWTGDADLDIRVKEPAGTICSLSNPQTVSGGVLLGDTSSRSEAASVDGFSEFYVCSQGYAGEYDVLIRRVYGEVTGGKVTVEVYTDFGSPEQTHTIRQIDLSSEGAMLQVAVKNGHRDEPIAAAQLAHIRTEQMETGAAVLGQFAGNDSADSTSASRLF